MPDAYSTIGQRIREARLQAKLSQKELADRLGVSASLIGQYENHIRIPKYETQQKIAHALGVDVYVIFSDSQRELFVEGEASVILTNLEFGYSFSDSEKKLIKAFSKLSKEGQQKAIERVEELAEIPKYKKAPDATNIQD